MWSYGASLGLSAPGLRFGHWEVANVALRCGRGNWRVSRAGDSLLGKLQRLLHRHMKLSN